VRAVAGAVCVSNQLVVVALPHVAELPVHELGLLDRVGHFLPHSAHSGERWFNLIECLFFLNHAFIFVFIIACFIWRLFPCLFCLRSSISHT